MKIKKIIACLFAAVMLFGVAPKIQATKWTFVDVQLLIMNDEFFCEGVPQCDLTVKARALSNFLPLIEACGSIEYKVLTEYLDAISKDAYYYELDRYFDYGDWKSAQEAYLQGISIDLEQYECEHPFNCDEWLAIQPEICVLMDYSENYEEFLHNLRQLITAYRSNEIGDYYMKHLFIGEI